MSIIDIPHNAVYYYWDGSEFRSRVIMWVLEAGSGMCYWKTSPDELSPAMNKRTEHEWTFENERDGRNEGEYRRWKFAVLHDYSLSCLLMKKAKKGREKNEYSLHKNSLNLKCWKVERGTHCNIRVQTKKKSSCT